MPRVYHLDADARERISASLGAALAERREVAFACVFGSFLTGDPFRDIDIGAWMTDLADRRLDLELAASLSRDLGLPVDLRRINDAPIPFLFHVLRGRIVLARDEEVLAGLMERTAREYHDRAPLLRLATREAFGR